MSAPASVVNSGNATVNLSNAASAAEASSVATAVPVAAAVARKRKKANDVGPLVSTSAAAVVALRWDSDDDERGEGTT
jgi:hypothetical protein